MKDIVILIPSLEPNIKFIQYLKSLLLEFEKIYVVNDGSSKKYDPIFLKIKKSGINVLKNNVNLGKGRALKNGINQILNDNKNILGIVTADSDGQHSIADIKACAIELQKNPDKLILGVRDFNDEKVPFKSKYGNKITRTVFKLFLGMNLKDTQTGLRAFGVTFMKAILKVKGERFEFETNMLIEAKNMDVDILEVPIKTIYINENRSSHFNALKDSILIYKLFFKYIFSSVSSFLIDITIFSIFLSVFTNLNLKYAVIISTILSRTISSIYNYFINRSVVFKKGNKYSILKYYALVIIQMFVSAFLLQSFINHLNILINEKGTVLFLKILIDIIIFFVNYIIQREYIFKKVDLKRNKR